VPPMIMNSLGTISVFSDLLELILTFFIKL
jgi:hypothetical protein